MTAKPSWAKNIAKSRPQTLRLLKKYRRLPRSVESVHINTEMALRYMSIEILEKQLISLGVHTMVKDGVCLGNLNCLNWIWASREESVTISD